jgi:lipopolysaccharide export system permease protein
MRIMDRHVLREWLTIFVIVMAAIYGLRLMIEVSDSFPDLRRYGASGFEVLRYYAVISPSFLTYVLPIAVMVSLLYALGQMHRNNEIVAMRSAGVSLWTITRSLWLVVTGLSVLQFNMNSSIVPWSVEEARLIKTNLEFRWLQSQGRSADEIGVEYNLGYDNRHDRRLWQISKFSRFEHSAAGIQVSVLDGNGTEIRRVLAAAGVWNGAGKGWTLSGGVEVLDPRSPDLVRPVPFDRLECPEFYEDPEWMALLLRSPKNLSLYELGRVIESPDTVNHRRRAAYAVRYHALLASTFGCLIAAGLAVPFAVSGVRVNPAVGVSKALGLFGAYWVMYTICRLLGEQQALLPAVAAWVPTVVMSVVAVWLMWRAR